LRSFALMASSATTTVSAVIAVTSLLMFGLNLSIQALGFDFACGFCV
jgi:hypothetical protein